MLDRMSRCPPLDVLSRCCGFWLLVLLLAAAMSATAAAQDTPRFFAGALFGVSALSADARTVTSTDGATVSLYEPANGPAVNLFAGAHLAQYFSLQANWIWNENDLRVFSASTTAPVGFSERGRYSRQHAAVLDALVYFRRTDSIVRPYLGTGVSLIQFSIEELEAARMGGPLHAEVAAVRVGLRSHVGIDVAVSRRLSFRYSFSEMISGNPISASLTPPGRRGLMNFQNLFGIVGRF
jgi:outer membrane protein W